MTIKSNYKRNKTYKGAKRRMCMIFLLPSSSSSLIKSEGWRKTVYGHTLFAFLSLSLVLFVSTIVACFRYFLPTFLYIVSVDKSRQTNRHHGYICDLVVNLRCARKCIALFALVCDVAETRVALLYAWICACANIHNYKALTTTTKLGWVSYFMWLPV
jgi:hypothetical protein